MKLKLAVNFTNPLAQRASATVHGINAILFLCPTLPVHSTGSYT